MLPNGYIVGDGSWNLRIFITDLKIDRTLRVKSDLHIGGVMLKLVDDLDVTMDWSDHALWWPARNSWLTRTRCTLDQYGVQADATLHFTPMHKTLRIQLPDNRFLDCRLDCSIKTFNAVLQLCKELGIRHPEELSLCKPLEAHHLKYNYNDTQKKPRKNISNGNGSSGYDTNTFISSDYSPSGSSSSLERTPPFMCAPLTPIKRTSTPISAPVTPNGTWRSNGTNYSGDSNGAGGPVTTIEMLNGHLETSLSSSPHTPSHSKLIRPKTLAEKARMNVSWLDSSLSIMEQGIQEYETLRLRYKFYSFYDLNPKLDAVRIHQIYEQGKWQLLSEELDCTEEEALMFAALQLQITLQSNLPQNGYDDHHTNGTITDDIDAALNDLQITLEGSNSINGYNDISKVPELCDYLRFLKHKKFTLKAYKRYWFIYRDLQLRIYKSREEAIGGVAPTHLISLRGCEVTPDVNLAQNKFGIKLEVPSSEGMAEMCIRCDSETQYAKWMAACRLAAKGRTLADSSYDTEVQSIINFLEMQKPSNPSETINPATLEINPEDYLPPRFAKRLKGKAIQRIVEAHANVKDLPLVDAKMNYIKAWQSLPDFGVSLFVVRFVGQKKDELLGIAHNKIMRMDLNTGDHIRTWRFNTMKAWNVNWEVKHMMIQFEEGNVIFACQSADCKVVHEFIGGYIFLSMRSKEANQSLDEDMFHKLTGGWV